MKYFANIKTADELRKIYRELCLTLHPDRGGNEEEFKAMQTEFESLKAAFMNGTAGTSHTYTNTHTETAEERRQREEEERREREAWARWEEERRKEREEEERRERERKAKARPIYDARCKKWAHLMEDLRPYMEAEKKAQEAHGWRSKEYKKAACATNAARRRNLLKMAQATFKGVKFSLKYNNGWGGGYTISWQDGPSVQDFEAATDYDLFVSGWDTFDGMTDCAGYERADFTDFARNYNGLSGKITLNRTLSDANRRKLEDVIIRFCPDLGKNDDPETRKRYGLERDWEEIKNSMSRETLADLFRIFGADFDTLGEHAKNGLFWSYSLRQWADALADFFTFKNDEEKKQEKPAEFRPRYGEALRTLHRLTGVNLGAPQEGKKDVTFWKSGTVRGHAVRLSILEAVEAMERGESVKYGSFTDRENGESWGWGQFNGGYKVQQGRAAKFAAAGYTLKGAGYLSPNSFVTIDGITAETAAALRAELADIERQRAEWETGKADPGKANRKADSDRKSARNDSDTTGTDEAPADGLTLEDIPGGVAIVGDSRTTYKNRKAIKAHGAKWNRDAQQWQATDPDDVARLRAWFAIDNSDTNGTANTDDTANDSKATDNADNATDTTDTETSQQGEPEAADRAAYVVEILTRGEDIARPFFSNDRSKAAEWLAAKVEEMKQAPDRYEILKAKQGSILYYDIEADKYRLLFIWSNEAATSIYTLRRIRERWNVLNNTEIKHRAARIRQEQKEQETTDEATTTTANGPQSAKAGEADDHTTTNAESAQGAQDAPESGNAADIPAADVAALAGAFADIFRAVANAMQEAKKYEGVTIPAETLERWRTETMTGAKCAAAQLSEVCACLGCLTPESRKEFDALGVIFWTLADQLQRGFNPDTIAPATDYARGQLFDLIDRTQTPNQAAAVREATDQKEAA